MPLVFASFSIYHMPLVYAICFFLARTFSTHGGQSWVGIKIAIQLLKINSNSGKSVF